MIEFMVPKIGPSRLAYSTRPSFGTHVCLPVEQHVLRIGHCYMTTLHCYMTTLYPMNIVNFIVFALSTRYRTG